MIINKIMSTMKKYRMPLAAMTVIFCLMLLSMGINAQQSPDKGEDGGSCRRPTSS